jgi:phosphoribosylformylglycinamidine synthase PurS subunit
VVLLYRAEVRIELKPGVADPEGANTKKALELLGFQGVQNVKSVHAFAVDLAAPSEAAARKQVEEMCKRLLVNPVIHVPRITITNGNGAAKPAAAKKPKAKAPAARKPAKAVKAAKKATKKVVAKAKKAVNAQKTAKGGRR